MIKINCVNYYHHSKTIVSLENTLIQNYYDDHEVLYCVLLFQSGIAIIACTCIKHLLFLPVVSDNATTL